MPGQRKSRKRHRCAAAAGLANSVQRPLLSAEVNSTGTANRHLPEAEFDGSQPPATYHSTSRAETSVICPGKSRARRAAPPKRGEAGASGGSAPSLGGFRPRARRHRRTRPLLLDWIAGTQHRGVAWLFAYSAGRRSSRLRRPRPEASRTAHRAARARWRCRCFSSVKPCASGGHSVV